MDLHFLIVDTLPEFLSFSHLLGPDYVEWYMKKFRLFGASPLRYVYIYTYMFQALREH